MPQPITLNTFVFDTSTDNDGFFSVPHGLEVFDPAANGLYSIRAIAVGVRHLNGNWHTLEASNQVDNRFWWNQTFLQGLIASPDFHNRPVTVVVFALFLFR